MSNPIDKFINSYQGYVPNPTLFRSFFNDAIEYAKNKNQPLNMDLRDYFAANATEQDIEKHQWRTIANTGHCLAREQVMTREEAKYSYADAMMEARKK